jgi:hypothetical protein
MRKNFDSPLANHFSPVMQSPLIADNRRRHQQAWKTVE